MSNPLKAIRRVPAAFAALTLLASAVAPAFLNTAANANQLSSRSIQMSTSAPTTSANYLVSFTTSASASSLVIDFCTTTPIVGDSTACAAPSGMVTTGATASAGTGNIGGWTVTTPSANQIKMAAGTAAGAGTQTFTLNGITNPTAVGTGGTPTAGTFYARITTYTNATFGTYSSPTSPGNYVDYGGIALSTGATITITAKVMESLAFCVYTATCGDTTALNLGHGANTVLDTSAVDLATAKFSLSTNAKTGAIINLKGDTLKTTGGANSFAAAGTVSAIAAGTEKFGVDVSSPGSGITATTNYIGNGTTTGNYGLVLANVTSTYGDTIANTASLPVNASVSTLTFAATAGATTAAGIYTANEQLTATGTF